MWFGAARTSNYMRNLKIQTEGKIKMVSQETTKTIDETKENQTNQNQMENHEVNRDEDHTEAYKGNEIPKEDEGYTNIKPEGEPIYQLDVHIKPADLFDYSLRHSYTSPGGILSTIIGVLMVYAFFAKNASPLYLIFGIIVIVYIPVNLLLVSRQQAMQEAFRNPLHYAFYENGMEVSQGENREMLEWEYIVKAVATSNSIIVYTGKNRASVFPRRDLTPDATALIQVLSTHVDPKKMKIKQ